MTFTESNTVEQMILDAASGLAGTPRQTAQQNLPLYKKDSSPPSPRSTFVPAAELPRQPGEVMVESGLLDPVIRLNPRVPHVPKPKEEGAGMTLGELKAQVALGEDSRRQFKRDVTNPDALAAEMAAFANSDGGSIFLGVADDGSMPGLSRADVARLNQMIGNVAAQHIRSPLTVHTQNVKLAGGRLVIVLTVPKGIDKPYFDKNGIIWLKSGADKRRVNSKEELRRLFQISDQFHADELPTKAGIEKLDKLRFRDFLRDVYQQDYPEARAQRLRLLQNMNLATDEGVLNLAGVLLFAERPEWIKPQFVVKAIRYPGNDIHVTQYLDTEDFSGSMRKIFDDAMAFIMRNLRKVQAGRGVNAPGTPEIPPTVFEELFVNALVHRDYLISAPIRLFIFDNRIEIISPGHLPNSLTVEKIRAGNSVIRNPILVSYVAKGLLPYRGLGSGIKRALEDWPEIDFTDDREGNLFVSIVRRAEDVSAVTTKVRGEVAGEVTGEVAGEVHAVLQALSAKALTRAEAQSILKLRSQANFRERYLQPALDAELIEMTIPDKPRSSKQRYRLTAKGRQLLHQNGGRA